jgi:hypothetical protein
MSQELYADQIAEVTVTGSVVRIDLVSLSATERDEQQQPKAVFRQRIVMPLDGFIRSFRLMGQVVKQLGTRTNEQPKTTAANPQTTAPASAAPAPTLVKRSEPMPGPRPGAPAQAGAARPTSPNFE